MSEFARKLKQFRRQKGLTQKAFGDLVGVPQATVSKWEKGIQQPSVERFPKVAAELAHFLPSGFGEETQLGTTILAQGTDLTKPGRQAADLEGRSSGHHPAFGALKGMITLLPDVDYTEPADPEWGKVYED